MGEASWSADGLLAEVQAYAARELGDPSATMVLDDTQAIKKACPATAAGYRQLLVWARKQGPVRRAGVEGTGPFGAGLSRYLLA
ncbi:hypothetical protein [Streptomyces sp. IBSBF 3136]|uniref:hypothetical protein n=1 Tax=Streptomyces sp. IBSBF 3136 TaxID=2903524 RepID=UPI002FDB9CB2